MKHKPVFAYLLLWLAMVASFGFIEWERRERLEAANYAIKINCEFGNRNRTAIRTILLDANRRTQTSGQRTREEKRAAQDFYNRQLQRLKPFDCDSLMLP